MLPKSFDVGNEGKERKRHKREKTRQERRESSTKRENQIWEIHQELPTKHERCNGKTNERKRNEGTNNDRESTKGR